MIWYAFFKSVHVLAAVLWVGGAFVTQFYAALALRTRDGVRVAGFATGIEWIGLGILTTESLVLFFAGIGLLENGQSPWTWGMNWIVFGLIVFAASFLVGAGFLGPESGRIARLIESEGASSAAVTARIRLVLTVSRVELVFLIAVVWAMAVRPAGNAGWFWGALAVTAAAVAVAIGVHLRGAKHVSAPAAPALD